MDELGATGGMYPSFDKLRETGRISEEGFSKRPGAYRSARRQRGCIVCEVKTQLAKMFRACCYWLPGLGSNQGLQLQRLTCYRYTTGH